MLHIRLLTKADAPAYRSLRLRALKEHPEAFGASHEDEAAAPIEKLVERLKISLPNNPFFGAFNGETMMGQAALGRYNGMKIRHRAVLWGVYIVPEARGQGAGESLINAVLEYARSQPGLEDVVLSLTVGNEAARQLYVRLGFTSWGIHPNSLKLDGQYYDFEWMCLQLKA